MIARDGYLADFIASGVRILESACGPCIGMGLAPAHGSKSIRSFNRNFPGRCGSKSADVFLASPEVCAATMLTGEITDPRELGDPPQVSVPESAVVDDELIVPPAKDPESVEVRRGPNIQPLPRKEPIPDSLKLRVLLKVGDNITTDHIMPAGAKILPKRSNIPAIAEHVFETVDEEFVARCREWDGGAVLGGANYGQGSSREHAALAPMYLGVQVVISTGFARIHWNNLINFGILPLIVQPESYEAIAQGDEIEIADIHASLRAGERIVIRKTSTGEEFEAQHRLSARAVEILLAGGRLNYIRERAG
jgi:aconitate hydratase